MLRTVASLLFLLSLFGLMRGQNRGISHVEFEADLNFLFQQLEQNHPNMYCYSQARAWQQFQDSLLRAVPEIVGPQVAYQAMAAVSALLKDGHTLIFPGAKSDAFLQKAGFFPFRVHWDGQKLYCIMDFSVENAVPPGAEILSINGRPATDIVQFALARIMRDGNNLQYPTWLLNQYFPLFYGYTHGPVPQFTVRFQVDNAREEVVEVSAHSRAEMARHRRERYPDYRHQYGAGEGIQLEIEADLKLAILTIRDFDRARLRKIYQQNFRQELKNCFSTLREQQVKHLVVDLRDNQGGNIATGKYLLQHLLREPFSLVAGYAEVDRKYATDPQRRLRPCRGPAAGTFAPHQDTFQGQLYVLINGGSFSNTGIVARALQQAGRGTLLGAETGGSAYVLAGAAKQIVLPYSGIQVAMPRLQFLLDAEADKPGGGVLPEIPVKITIADLVAGRDPVMAQVRSMISEGQD